MVNLVKIKPPAKSLFTLLSRHLPVKTTLRKESREPVSWVPVLMYDERDNRLMGVNSKGFWVVEHRDGLFVVDEERNYFFLILLLERPMEETIADIRNNPDLKVFFKQTFDAFPFIEIVKQGFRSKRDSWIDCAFQWFEELAYEHRLQLSDDLEEIRQTRSISQKNRHRAQRALAKLR